MEKLEADIEGKVKLLIFTLGKTQGIQHSGSVLALTRHHEALNTIVKQIDSLRLQVVEGRFKRGDSDDDITKWSAEIDNHVAQVDTKVTLLNEHLASIRLEDLKAQETEKACKAKEREDQLEFERAQLEQKLEFERKLEESRKKYVTTSSEVKASEAPRTKLPKLSY